MASLQQDNDQGELEYSEEDCFLKSDDQSLAMSSKCKYFIVGDMDDNEDMSDEENDRGEVESILFEDNSCNYFDGHKDNPVYALATLGSYVVSGGGDDRCFCWNPNTGEPVYSEVFAQRMVFASTTNLP